MSRAKIVSDFLGLTKSTTGLLLMVILVAMGERMAERFLPIYLLALGGGVISIGLLNGLDNFLSAVYAFPGGYLSERIGSKRALLVFNFMAMAGFLIVILIPAWQAVLVGAVFFSGLVGDFPAGNHGPDCKGVTDRQAYHGGYHAFTGASISHGAGTHFGGAVHRRLGGHKRRPSCLWCGIGFIYYRGFVATKINRG